MREISEQKKWENSMTALGISRFRAAEQQAKENKRFTDTSAGNRLMQVYISQVSQAIMEKVASKGARNMHIKLLRGLDCDKLALFTLHRVIECLFTPVSLQKITANIGKMVEDELRFSKFEIELPEYYNAVIRDLDSRNSAQYRHRHRVLVQTMNGRGVEWNSWSNEAHIAVGALLLGCAEENSDLIVRKRSGNYTVIEPSAEAIEWIKKHEGSMEMMLPDRMPCIRPPQDWTDWKDGGFYTNKLKSLTPLVKTRAGQQRDTQAPLLDSVSMPTVLSSVNAMQNTSWKINAPLLAVAKEIWERDLEVGMPRSQPYEIPKAPIAAGIKPADLTGSAKERFEEWKAEARTLHSLENDRQAAVMSTVRAMRMASNMQQYDLLWMVYQLDFRGRTYSTTSGVSPQGSDISKALLTFGVAKEMGTQGWYWFQVHGANKFGNDKGSYDARVAWVKENSAAFVAAGSDPLGNTDAWKGADKPFQFLAWCMEYAQAMQTPGGPAKFMSNLPIALDGSCNGLQHFSAMLRDPVGGAAVNLTPSDKPADIYQSVADVATEKLKVVRSQPEHEHNAVASNWMALFDKLSKGKMDRSLAKKPVMTLPYGSTMQTCTQTIYSWYLAHRLDFFPENTAFKHSIFLSKILWDSISEVVIAARAAMDWLQKSARKLAKVDSPIVFTTPTGFPMVQFSPNMRNKKINAQIGGRVQMQIRKELPGVDSYKASSGSSPNLTHSIDGSHLHMVVNAGVAEGMTHFAMIHDDFGVHACHVQRWHEIIREQFVKLHTETNVLEEFKKQQEEASGIELPELPTAGTLDLDKVRESLYFFG